MSTYGHKIEPIRQGRYVTCRACGRLVSSVRATKVIPKRHWRHQPWTNSPEHLARINPNREI